MLIGDAHLLGSFTRLETENALTTSRALLFHKA